jgi:hypothetical protein
MRPSKLPTVSWTLSAFKNNPHQGTYKHENDNNACGRPRGGPFFGRLLYVRQVEQLQRQRRPQFCRLCQMLQGRGKLRQVLQDERRLRQVL